MKLNSIFDKSNYQPLIIKIFMVLVVIVLIPILAIGSLIYYSWSMILSFAIWIVWGLQGRYILFVYSDSPLWSSYIEDEILPYIRKNAITLNWSERKQWKASLAVLAFKLYGGSRNFNPLAIVFRPFRFHKIFRFHEAFKDFKHGNSKKLESIKENFFRAIGIIPA